MKVGRFTKKIYWQARVDMSPSDQELFERVGNQVITKDQIINIGFNYCLMRGLQTRKPKKK